jgi:tricorn protease
MSAFPYWEKVVNIAIFIQTQRIIKFYNMKQVLLIACACLLSAHSFSQISARLMRYPDVSETHITFVYGDDIWIVSKSGGTASRLSSPAGEETFPKFSPDGKHIAYTANYDGNPDVYVIESMGGIPTHLTHHGMPDRTLGWHPSGDKVLFASARESGRQRFNQFYTIPLKGGPPEKLEVPYGEYASYSPDGTKIAFTDRSRVQRTWKRYRGGTAPDIHIFDLSTGESRNITNNDANDELPMWHGNVIYYLSDQGAEQRANIWKYDLASGNSTQITDFKDFDIHFPSIGPSDLVFQAGDQLYLMNLATEEYSPVDVKVIFDQAALMPVQKNVASTIQSAAISPDGKRVVIQARGELFSLPAGEGYVANLTQTSGAAERSPSWSPDGKYVAYWSDKTGEYQLTLNDMKGMSPPRTVTDFDSGFRYEIFWSPDSKKIAYVNQAMNVQVLNVENGNVTTIDQGKFWYEGALQNFSVSWSPDSRWIVYSREKTRVANALFLYDTQNNKLTQLTSGYYNDSDPVFSQDGKYLFFRTFRNYQPTYSDLDNTFIYPNSSMLAVGTLANGTPSLLSVKNDEVSVEEESQDPEMNEKDKKKSGKKDKKEESSTSEKQPEVVIDVADFEKRVELLDLEAGNYGSLSTTDGKLLFVHYPNTGSPQGASSELKLYDYEERKAKSIIEGVGGYLLSADGKSILIRKDGAFAVIPVTESASIDKKVPVQEMTMSINPREEWRQIFQDAWRLQRDYFYDPNMHGVDWEKMRKQYGDLIEQANTRTDVNFILGELIGELNASHTYRGGGDLEEEKNQNVGYLGANFKINNNYYQVDSIIEGAPWDVEVRSPLAKPGAEVKEGDYILAINGQPVDASKPLHAWLQGMANTPVALTVNSKPTMSGSRQVVVEPLDSETRLRHLAWIESNRKRVEEATDGKAGYVYVRSTGIDGQNELIRQYYAQLDKPAMIIDERFNSGGQIPDRFIELLNRKPLAFWAVRDGEDWAWPPVANFGPKVMLINGFSGSGGDAFPDYFRKTGLGPLIGTRTWGGLIGISGAPALIDNGSVTVPTFRMYDPDGTWFKEGYGVDPDIKVEEDFGKLSQGEDVQLEAAIDEIMKRLNAPDAFTKPERPAYENRTEN